MAYVVTRLVATLILGVAMLKPVAVSKEEKKSLSIKYDKQKLIPIGLVVKINQKVVGTC